jgi:NitT/TauT family transport system substrate-binding protein
LILVIFSVLSPSPWARAEEGRKIFIQSPPTVGVLPLIWVQEQGVLPRGIDLEIIISQDHQRGLSLISSGDLDLLVTGVNVGAKAYNRGIDLQLVNTNIWGIDYLLTSGFQAESWKDLEGRTLSLPLQGGPLDFLARYFLHNHGVDLDQIDFAYLPSNNGARAFQLGRLDAIILPEPMVTITLNNYDQAVLSLDIQEEWGKLHAGEERIPFVGLFVQGGFAKENSELVDLLHQYYQEGVDWVQSHPEAAAELAAQHFGQPAALVQESLGRIHLQVYPQDEARELIELLFTEIMDYYPEMIGGRLPDGDFYF